MDKTYLEIQRYLFLYLGWLSLSLKNKGRVSDFVYYSSKIDYFSVKWTFLANFGLKNSDYCTPYTSVFLYICHRLK